MQFGLCPLRPFDQHDALVERLGKAEFAEFRGVFHTVEIDMGDEEGGALIGLDKGEGGRWNLFGKTVGGQMRLHQRAGERCLAGAKVTAQKNKVARRDTARKRRAKGDGGLRIGQDNIKEIRGLALHEVL